MVCKPAAKVSLEKTRDCRATGASTLAGDEEVISPGASPLAEDDEAILPGQPFKYSRAIQSQNVIQNLGP